MIESEPGPAWRAEFEKIEGLIAGDPAAATAAAQAIVAKQTDHTDAERCRALLVLAKIALNKWELERCAEFLNQASPIEDSFVEDDSLTFKVVRAEYLSKSHDIDGSLGLAREVVERTLVRYQDGDESQKTLQLLWRSTFMAGIAYSDLGRFGEALAEFERLLEVTTPDDPSLELMLTANIGYSLIDLGQPDKAANKLAEAMDGFAELGEAGYQQLAAVHLAYALARQGLFDQALATIREAGIDAEAAREADDWAEGGYEIGAARLILAEIYWLMGAADDARELLALALPAAATRTRVRDLKQVALVAAEVAVESAPDEAIDILDSLLVVAQRRGDHLLHARTVIRTLELFPEHLDAQTLTEAASVIESLGSNADVVRLNLLLVSRAEQESVGQCLARAKDAAQECTDPSLLWQLHASSGRLALDEGRHEEARASFRAAVQILREIFTSIPDEHLRIRYRSAHAHVVDDLTHVLLELGLADELFELMDETYGITLRERLQGAVSPSQWPRVSGELDSLYSQMTQAGPMQWETLHRAASELGEQSAVALVDRPPEASAPVESASIVRPRYHLVFGICGAEVFALVKRQEMAPVLCRHLTTPTELERLRLQLELQRRRSEIDALQSHGAQLDAITNQILTDLFDVMLDRAARSVGVDLESAIQRGLLEQVVVVPPPGFDDLPFCAFRSQPGPVVSAFALCVAPSTSLAEWVGGRARDGRSTLAVGFSSSGLQFPEEEASRIGEFADGQVLVGAAATIERVAALAPDHDVIHIASHGIARDREPWLNGVQLADGWLSTAELSTWRFDGQIFVLSGCHTARQSARGHEQLGLPRALLAAGAGGVIASIADLDDEAATDFMLRLHWNLRECGPAEALRRTQVAFASNGTDLRQWASVAYIGGPDRVQAAAS